MAIKAEQDVYYKGVTFIMTNLVGLSKDNCNTDGVIVVGCDRNVVFATVTIRVTFLDLFVFRVKITINSVVI